MSTVKHRYSDCGEGSGDVLSQISIGRFVIGLGPVRKIVFLVFGIVVGPRDVVLAHPMAHVNASFDKCDVVI